MLELLKAAREHHARSDQTGVCGERILGSPQFQPAIVSMEPTSKFCNLRGACRSGTAQFQLGKPVCFKEPCVRREGGGILEGCCNSKIRFRCGEFTLDQWVGCPIFKHLEGSLGTPYSSCQTNRYFIRARQTNRQN